MKNVEILPNRSAEMIVIKVVIANLTRKHAKNLERNFKCNTMQTCMAQSSNRKVMAHQVHIALYSILKGSDNQLNLLVAGPIFIPMTGSSKSTLNFNTHLELYTIAFNKKPASRESLMHLKPNVVKRICWRRKCKLGVLIEGASQNFEGSTSVLSHVTVPCSTNLWRAQTFGRCRSSRPTWWNSVLQRKLVKERWN